MTVLDPTSTLPHFQRTRRLRTTPAIRDYVRETELRPRDFVLPLFVVEGTSIRHEISSMPGQFQLSVDNLATEVDELQALGISGVLLFGIPAVKDSAATGAFAEDGVVQQAIREIRRVAPDLLIITDVCACEYTDHGHCGILVGDQVDNDLTLPLLARTAVSHAAAGADIVAPSDMMDGRVVVIRSALDSAGYPHVPIMSYAAKYASAYYGPFREAAESTPTFGDRRSHQMDPANAREALREIAIDLDEGADLIIVKPALSYLDIIHAAREAFDVPITAYNVSGEYAMIKAAARLGWIDEERVTLETLLSMKRAGAGRIITYHAKDAARWLGRQS
jgi:porphobilinogen synthase